MRDRLIELINGKLKEEFNNVPLRASINVADHLIANGVIVPPCLEGQDIYIVKKNKVELTFARTFKYHGKEIGLEVEATHWKRDRDGWLKLKTDIIHESEFGKTVFLTREEAEKALAEREDKG